MMKSPGCNSPHDWRVILAMNLTTFVAYTIQVDYKWKCELLTHCLPTTTVAPHHPQPTIPI